MTKFTFRFKSQGTEKIQLFSQRTDDSVSLVTTDYKCREISVLLPCM